MNIMLIGNFGVGWDGSICDEKNISVALTKLDHTVMEMYRGNLAVTDTTFPADFILIFQWNGYEEHVVQKLKDKYKCPVVYWAFDYHGFQPGWHLDMAKEADLFLSKEIGNRQKYEEAGCNFRWLAQDFAPDFLDADTHFTEEYDVVFTGSYIDRATDRIEYLKELDKEFDLHIFGVTEKQWSDAGFKNSHGPIMDEGLSKLYANAKVVISIDWVTDCEGYWSDRNAQIMACGGVPVFKYIPMSEVAFKDKVVYFKTKEEMVKIVRELLEDKEMRDSIRINGYEYAQRYMTAISRVKDMLTIIKGEL